MNAFDIIGPVMIGPSSSHTAGAVRIGRAARALLGTEPVRAEIGLHGSFARTYKGHGTDKALIAGILGLAPDDERIRFSPALARQAMAEHIKSSLNFGAHPNTALLTLWGAAAGPVSVQAASVGGGSILVSRVNGMEVQFSGQYTTLIVLHKDAPGTIAAVTELLAAAGVNICNFRLARRQKGGAAVMTIETDGSFGAELNRAIGRLPNVLSSTLLPRM